MDEFEPFVAFVQSPPDVDLDAPLPSGAGLVGPEVSFFEVLEAKILDAEELDQPIAPSDRPGGPSELPERASNETAVKRTDEPDLEPFRELNAHDKRVPWKDRYEVVKTQFPSVVDLDWEKVFRADPTIMGNILNDIIKVQVAPKGRPGKRPALDRSEATEVLKQYRGEDYTILPFAKAINRLKNTLSVRQFARKVSMSPTYAHNLITGYKQPTVEDMLLVADAFGKKPSYFYEYRVAFITALMVERVDYAPESSIIYYERALEARRKHA